VSSPFDELLGQTVGMTVRDVLPRGAYLVPTSWTADPNAQTILLPRRECPEHVAPGQNLAVFVYLDSEDRPIATTRAPSLELGQVAFLPVTDLAPFGAFVNWGLPKELLVPFAEQTAELHVGKRYAIGLIRDDTGRLSGTMRISEMLRNKPKFSRNDWVSGEAWRNTPNLGVFVIVERSCVGLLPNSEPHRLERGQEARFRVANVLPDGKLELSLRRLAVEELEDDASRLLEFLRLPNRPSLGDHSSPEQIRDTLGLSKKAFKRALGRLLKSGAVGLDAHGCVVVK
jgi:predicted RNA-binding protein (virulence factor B family)